jgi:hypothetical protein
MTDPTAPRRPGPFEWFTRTHALALASSAAPTGGAARSIQRALSAVEVVELALEPHEEFRNGDPNEVIALVLSEALRAALCAKHGLDETTSLDAAVAQVTRDALAGYAPEGVSVSDLLAWLGERRSDFATLTVSEADARIESCRAFVRAAVTEVETPVATLGTLRRQRFVRSASAIVALLATIGGGGFAAKRAVEGPELASGKPFVASSVSDSFGLTGRTNEPALFDLFYHTLEEDNPWVKIDLERVERVGKVTVRNRVDCCGERAIPLVIEASVDGDSWTELARRAEPFYEWTASFPQTKARFLRLSVPRRTPMHLSRVFVWR